MALASYGVPLRIILPLLVLGLTIPSTCLVQDSNGARTTIAGVRRAGSSSTMTYQPSATSSAPAQTHTIQVGLADHKFNPNVTRANVGDTIKFDFYPANHSVVRAEYGYPCIPYELTGPNKIGFFAGFHPIDKVLDDPPNYTITINNTDPIFFYCSAPGSCLTYGMVGAINPTNSTSIDKQKSLAQDSSYMLNPGDPFPREGTLSTSPPSATATSTAGPIIVEPPNQPKRALSAGTIAGIAVAAISLIVLAALLFFFWGRTKSLKDEVSRSRSTVTHRLSPDSGTRMLEARNRSGGSRRNGTMQVRGLGIYQHYNSPAAVPEREYSSKSQPLVPYDKVHASFDSSVGRPMCSTHPNTSITTNGALVELPPEVSTTPPPTLTYCEDSYPPPPPPPPPPSTQTYHHASQNILPPTYGSKLGPYGRQRMSTAPNAQPAPSYADTVSGRGGFVVQEGLVEMDGTGAGIGRGVALGVGGRGSGSGKLDVEKEREGGVDQRREGREARARWEEVHPPGEQRVVWF